MSITTERTSALTRLAAAGRGIDGRGIDGRDTLDRTTRSGQPVRTSRPRTSCASLDRRRYLHAVAQQDGCNRVIDHSSADRSFDDEAPRQTMSWTATIAGVLITAIVLLGLVGLANLRAGYLDGGSAGAVTVVEQGGFVGTAGQDLIAATDSGQ
ncbi:hypothetical protein E5720_01405 [Rhodococcus sp. PAMC28707]|uniref:hypothetical protein n=1 Tax=unclassified Rhodococcus (in: high G+C Gram-positive bacteria) TaxID=192944 RepID=UPI00109DD0A8|nr:MULTISPECIES: hypothetical protein [unclassified Rhodococcus (in: high G+C Gram-positive bacteria)]QCB50954.1 hypothetical protein E5769_12610 [Rhodococcus sp. PAMC28705]QCB57354.1 hypothetical protein E5720_01405 [Rhodococcus sp. PAMC28707]